MHCLCDAVVYFDNHSCGTCGRQLAFDPDTLDMRAEESFGAGLPFCSNRFGASQCNWIASDEAEVCLSCRTSRTIPALSKTANRRRWRLLETAKRRLLCDVLRLGLPVDPTRLAFDFKEDRRTNPLVSDDFVSTGHTRGVITINAAEADEVFRAQMRIAMNEPVRTLLGHFRHESGHYFFNEVVTPENHAEAKRLFGDETVDYHAALSRYYQDGPPAGWQENYISGYASAHPSEDWAECWSHYLQIRAALEVADEAGLLAGVTSGNWYTEFVSLVVALNEIMRSFGLADAYPFVLTRPVVAKVEFVHRAVGELSPPGAS